MAQLLKVIMHIEGAHQFALVNPGSKSPRAALAIDAQHDVPRSLEGPHPLLRFAATARQKPRDAALKQIR